MTVDGKGEFVSYVAYLKFSTILIKNLEKKMES